MDFTFVTVRAFKPLKPKDPDFTLNGSDYNGVPTLTSLAFQYKGKQIELLECIVTINQEKNIVTTPMQGRDGTIKEYISDGDFAITIDAAVNNYNPSPSNNDLRAVLSSGDVSAKAEDEFQKSKAYPIEKLQELITFLKVKDGLEVQSDFLTLFEIKSAVIKTYGMVQETHSNRQSFQIQMLSDTPYEIKIQQDATISK